MTASDQLRSVEITAFVGVGTEFALKPPRDYVLSGTPGRTSWILRISTGMPQITLHVDDPAKLWELHDLIAATLPPREQAGDGLRPVPAEAVA
jgi:hypothetical protein